MWKKPWKSEFHRFIRNKQTVKEHLTRLNVLKGSIFEVVKDVCEELNEKFQSIFIAQDTHVPALTGWDGSATIGIIRGYRDRLMKDIGVWPRGISPSVLKSYV